MPYILNEEWALRGWVKAPHALYHLPSKKPFPLTAEEFTFLLRCDGRTVAKSDATLAQKYLAQQIIAECAPQQALRDEQRYYFYANRYFETIEWAITRRCNYHCKHCFVSGGASSAEADPSLEQCLEIIDQIAACGFREIWLTGGEPLLYDYFTEAVRHIKHRGLWLRYINSNGSLISEDLLAELEAIGVRPTFNISLDGLGMHDWMRGVEGAEQDALRAIMLLTAKGFTVRLHICIHRGNLPTIWPTLQRAYALGVKQFRIIPTIESPRWQESVAEPALTAAEYYEAAAQLLAAFKQSGMAAHLIIWNVLSYDNPSGESSLLCEPERDIAGQAVCRSARSMLFLSTDGRLCPCNQISGVLQRDGQNWGNIYDTSLAELLTQSCYLERVSYSLQQFWQRNAKCAACTWRYHCQGGCRAIAYEFAKDYLAPDVFRCTLYEQGFYERLKAIVLSEK